MQVLTTGATVPQCKQRFRSEWLTFRSQAMTRASSGARSRTEVAGRVVFVLQHPTRARTSWAAPWRPRYLHEAPGTSRKMAWSNAATIATLRYLAGT